MKKNVIIISVLMIVGFGLGVGAATIFNAKDVGYIPKNVAWKVDNLGDAIDELYLGVTDGKKMISDAIKNNGVDVTSDNTYLELASAISELANYKIEEGSKDIATALHSYFGDQFTVNYSFGVGGLDGHQGCSFNVNNGPGQAFYDLMTKNGYTASGYGNFTFYNVNGWLYPGSVGRDNRNYNDSKSVTITYTWVGV